jgi:hypothetical protein
MFACARDTGADEITTWDKVNDEPSKTFEQINQIHAPRAAPIKETIPEK